MRGTAVVASTNVALPMVLMVSFVVDVGGLAAATAARAGIKPVSALSTLTDCFPAECEGSTVEPVCNERCSCKWENGKCFSAVNRDVEGAKKEANIAEKAKGSDAVEAIKDGLGCGKNDRYDSCTDFIGCEWVGEYTAGSCVAALPEHQVETAPADAPNRWTKGISGLNIMVVNLDERTDRLSNFKDTLGGIDINNFDRIPGVKFDKGLYKAHDGCAQAHLNALKHAMDAGWDRYLCFEDDFTLNGKFAGKRDAVDKAINDALSDLENNERGWDVLFVSGRINRKVKSKHVSRVLDSTAASGYIVNKRFYSTWQKLLTDHLEANPDHDVYNPLDTMWLPLQKEHNFYVLNERLGNQAAGLSNIEKMKQDYGPESAALLLNNIQKPVVAIDEN